MDEKLDTMNMPRFSFLLISYNQENYIEEALQSAFDQDYPNLEIVVCDDCSQDRTFELASRMAQAYHGPHRVILHRNERNLGIGANFQQAYELSSGDWLFMAAGDDVSLPNRCRVVAEGISEFPNALAFSANYELIDEAGTVFGYSRERHELQPGAVITWHRSVFSQFPPLDSTLRVEDAVLLPRVFYLGGVYVKLPQILLKYRFDGHSFLGVDRNTAYKVKVFQMKTKNTFLNCMAFRKKDLNFLQEAGFEIKRKEQFIALLDFYHANLMIEKRKCEELIRVMEASAGRQIKYVLGLGDNLNGYGILRRIKIILSCWHSLQWLKSQFPHRRTLMEAFMENHNRKAPETTQAIVVDANYYLTHADCDYYMVDDLHNYTQDYLPKAQHLYA